jgi:hypothetical protein
MDEKLIEEIILKLDEYARDYDNYDYGLPLHDEHMDKMKAIIQEIIKKGA